MYSLTSITFVLYAVYCGGTESGGYIISQNNTVPKS